MSITPRAAPSPPEPRSPPHDFKEMQWGLGYLFIFALAFGIGAVPALRFNEFWASHFGVLEVSQCAVLLALVLLAFRWIEATRHELHLWLIYTDLSQEPRYTLGAIVGLAFYLGVSIAFFAHPFLVTVWFTFGTAFSCWTQSACNRLFASAGPRSGMSEIPHSMSVYWLKRPHGVRSLMITIGASIACLFSLYGWLRGGLHKTAFEVAAYWILFVDVLLAELQIGFWRRSRDRGIQQTSSSEYALLVATRSIKDAQLQAFITVLPVVSFVGQLFFSIMAGTLPKMVRHPAVMYADWFLVPFNYLAARVIDWQRGATLYLITIVSTVLVLWTHAIWQAQGADPGHMISSSGAILAAGWIHVGFSIVEMNLLVAFVFCRRIELPTFWATVTAACYFVVLAAGGIRLHHKLILTDCVVLVAGLFFTTVYPKLRQPLLTAR